jgi:hypothetical protein
LAISLLAVSTAFLSSTALAWQVMSNEGILLLRGLKHGTRSTPS